MYRRTLIAMALLLLGGCRSSNETVVEREQIPYLAVSAARAAVLTIATLQTAEHFAARPAATLGLYSTLYLTQDAFVATTSARQGIVAQQSILRGQQSPEESETFALLKELASILEVDIPDTLNRSTDRAAALDQYVRSLRNILQLTDRKIQELTTLEEQLTDETKEQKKKVRELERTTKDALNDERYEEASGSQEELAKESAALAELEIKKEQATTILEPFERLKEIGAERLTAIENNENILTAGLKVIDVPGIDDLDIIERQTLFGRFTGQRQGDGSETERFGTVPSVIGD